MFIGRNDELKILENRYHSNRGELVVLYGRRRVGKTELLHQFCKNKKHVFYACTECADSSQLSAFSERMMRAGHPAAKYISSFSDWSTALSAVAELPSNEKKLLVIDEFPYMVRNNAEIPSILQNLWDAILQHSNVMIILCGSAMSFIEKEILSEKNPLYGRATCIMQLKDMDYYDAAQFFPSYSAEDKIRAYAILGGIPHYLKQFSDTQSIGENIIAHILTRASILYSEVEFMMRQEFRESAVYNTILNAIALGATQLNEIWQKTQIDKNKLSVYLKNLIEVGLVCREFSMAEKLKEQGNVQRGLYQIKDPFFRFWYTYVFPYIPELDSGDTQGIYEHVVAPTLDQFVSRPFEDICIQYLRRLNRAGQLDFHFTHIGRWWTKQTELDILAIDHDKKHYLACECKFKNTPISQDDIAHAQSKFTLPANADIQWFFFSKSGFTDGATTHKNCQLINPINLYL